MADGLLEEDSEKLNSWMDQHILLVGIFASAISYGLIGNFIVHAGSWFTSPLKLVIGIVGVFFGFYGTMICIRGIRLATGSDEEYTFVQEIATAVLLLPVCFVWVPVDLVKDLYKDLIEGDTSQ